MASAGIVLDASAMLAYLKKETGGLRVRQAMVEQQVAMCAINYAEVVYILSRTNRDTEVFRDAVAELKIALIPFDDIMAYVTGLLKTASSKLGLSLAHCACLCLARQLDAVALTADTAWSNLNNDFNVEVIR